ncbi:hypothetical protein NMG60_11033991 [Bertholletia excelsa]
MASFGALGIGLSFVFGCMFLGLVAELYYLLWYKKRVSSREIEEQSTSYAKELSHLFVCWKKPSSVDSTKTQQIPNLVTDPDANAHEPDLEQGPARELLRKGYGEEGVESELMRLHNLCGPPRFLFTIKEETKEDLESEDRSRKGSRTRSLSDILLAVETPMLTPLASPTLKNQSLDSYNHHGFNPLFESTTELDLNKMRSSPPPKFKFLRDAEEKLIRRLVEEAERRASLQDSWTKEEREGSFIRIIVGKNKERETHQKSQVLPLASSPSALQPIDDDKPTKQ